MAQRESSVTVDLTLSYWFHRCMSEKRRVYSTNGASAFGKPSAKTKNKNLTSHHIQK